VAANLSKEQRAEKRRRAWSLRQRGWTEQRIADELQVNQSTVSRYLDQLTRRSIANLDDRIARDFLATLGILDHAIDEAAQAWERSKKPRKKASKRTGAGGKAGPGEQTTAESTERDGDPAFWQILLSALDRKRQLLALDERFAPPKSDDGPGHGGMTVLDALAEAEARDAEYDPDPDGDATDEADPDPGPADA
jgi:predicted transcriptional regulator